MWRVFLAFSVMLFFAGCGKNDLGVMGPNYPYQGPINQAPYYPSQPNYSPRQPYGPGPVFNPQIPPSMPPQFYPFLPVYNYFYQQPMISYVWPQIWSQWIIYANNCGCGTYNFPIFWEQYFPQVWNYGNYVPFYQYMSTTFYPWMGSAVTLPTMIDSTYFWSNYSGLPLCGEYNFSYYGW